MVLTEVFKKFVIVIIIGKLSWRGEKDLKIQNIIKNIIIVMLFMVIMILIPCILDIFVFGNDLKSNLTNSKWASFLGSYSGSVATLIVLVGTILYTNHCNKQQEKSNYI